MTEHSTVVVFDLDDTLIDTTGVLVPEALGRVATAAGVPVAALDRNGKSIDEVLARNELSAARRAAAAAAWYAPDVPPLKLLPGARALVERLARDARIRLVLLTRGDPARQRSKVEACGADAFFEDVRIRPIEGGGSKRDDLEAVLARYGVEPGSCVVVGDDEGDELAHARALGCVAVKVPDTPWDVIAQIIDEVAGEKNPNPP